MLSTPEQSTEGTLSDAIVAQKPRKWTRVCGRKVKTGCSTCKIRRIKCDEQKPECFRCQISGRKCDGYAQKDQSSKARKHRDIKINGEGTKRSSSRISVSTNPPRITITIDTEITGSQEERRSFHHFRVRTADDLSGYFPSNFWGRLVLQLGHFEPAIKHALVAVAAAHENYQIGLDMQCSLDSDTAFGLQQYNKAIACLNKQLSTPDKRSAEVALICCALFICFEGLRGSYEGALLHLQSGVDIIKTWSTPISSGASNEVPYLDPCSDGDELLELFTRLDFSASAFVPDRPPKMTTRLPYPPTTKVSFRNLLDARRSLERLVNRTLFLLIQIQGHATGIPTSEQEDLLAAVSAWSAQFDALLKSPKMANLSGKDLTGAFTLIMHKKTIALMLQTCHCLDPSIFSQFNDDIESIVTIGAFIISPSSDVPIILNSLNISAIRATKQSQPGHPTFASGMGIIAPLYYVLMNSQSPRLREIVLNVLKIARRREGIWDSMAIARIGEQALQLERGVTRNIDPLLHSSNLDMANVLERYQVLGGMS